MTYPMPSRRVALSLCLIALLQCGGCGDLRADAKILRFTAIPDTDQTELLAKFGPVAEYLSDTLGVPVEYVPAVEYADSVALFKNGDVHLAWFGGLSGVQARAAVPGARAIVQGARDPEFYSYFIAHRDSGLTDGVEFPLALAGKSFIFGSDGSTSGRLMPEHFIRLHSGKTPAEFFGAENAYSGSHDKTIEKVRDGQFQAGAVSYTRFDRWVAEGRVDPEVVRVIWRTPPYPDYNFTAHAALETEFGSGFTDRVQRALLAMRDPALLAAFEREELIPADNGDFAVIEELARELGFIRG